MLQRCTLILINECVTKFEIDEQSSSLYLLRYDIGSRVSYTCGQKRMARSVFNVLSMADSNSKQVHNGLCARHSAKMGRSR